jgi:hypothetical protein
MQQHLDLHRAGTLVLDANSPIFSAFKGIQKNQKNLNSKMFIIFFFNKFYKRDIFFIFECRGMILL